MTCSGSVIEDMCSTPVLCPNCGSDEIKPFCYSKNNVPRYRCCNDKCETKTFMLEYRYKAYEPGIKEKVVGMAINGSGIRDNTQKIERKNLNFRTEYEHAAGLDRPAACS